MVRIYDTNGFDQLFQEKSIRVFRVDDTKVCIAQYKDGFFAFEFLCPHQKHPLKDAKVTAFGEVVCPLHEYRFSLEFGNESNHKCNPLKRFKLHIKSDGVYLEL